MLRVIQSLTFWAFLLVSSILLFPAAVLIWALTLPIDRRKVVLHRFTCFWGSLYTWLNPVWNVEIIDRHKLVRDQATVMVANHLSLLDILVLFRLFTHFKWVSKAENFRLPFIGWNMHLNRYIPLERGVRASVVQMMRDAGATLQAGNSVMMFPEGTRSPNGRMRRFKTGAFELALKTGVPIQPIVIRGTANALPKAGFVLQGRHPISIKVLDAIPIEHFEGMAVEDVTLEVRQLILDQLDEPPSSKQAPSTARSDEGEAVVA
jgi:1-acyl-sn-glycerol-3-phosphate acyltransferase